MKNIKLQLIISAFIIGEVVFAFYLGKGYGKLECQQGTQPKFELSPKDVVLQGSFDGKNYQNIECDTLTIKGNTRRMPLHSQYRIKIVQSNTQTVIK